MTVKSHRVDVTADLQIAVDIKATSEAKSIVHSKAASVAIAAVEAKSSAEAKVAAEADAASRAIASEVKVADETKSFFEAEVAIETKAAVETRATHEAMASDEAKAPAKAKAADDIEADAVAKFVAEANAASENNTAAHTNPDARLNAAEADAASEAASACKESLFARVQSSDLSSLSDLNGCTAIISDNVNTAIGLCTVRLDSDKNLAQLPSHAMKLNLTTSAPEDEAGSFAEAIDSTMSNNSSDLTPPRLPLAFIENLRGLSGLRGDVSSILRVIGDAVGLADSAVVTQEHLDDCAIIQQNYELKLHFQAICQGLNSIFHVAAAFHSGIVEIDKNTGFNGMLGAVSHAAGVVDNVATKARTIAQAGSGSLQGVAGTIAKFLDSTAHLADGIPIASFVLNGMSCMFTMVQSLKFDVRMKLIIKQLFPTLNPTCWSSVVEQIARRVTVSCAADINTLYTGTSEDRGKINMWFRSKCADYGMVTLTGKAEDCVVMMALQKVDAVLQLTLHERVPAGLEGKKLADFIISHITTPVASASFLTASAPACARWPASYIGQSPLLPQSTPEDVASHHEFELLRTKIEKQEALNKQLGERLRKIEKLVPQDKDNEMTGIGGGLVLASSKSELNADSIKSSATQVVRPLQQQQMMIQRHLQVLSDFILSSSDPVLKSHLEDLINAAVPVMKKHNDVIGWQDRYMAVRRGILFYANTFKDVKAIADGHVHPTTGHHIIDLRGCSVLKCPEETDKSHFAFILTTNQSKELLWSTSDAALRLAIIETIARFGESLDAASSATQHLQHLSVDEHQRRLLLGKSDAARDAYQGETEDFS